MQILYLFKITSEFFTDVYKKGAIWSSTKIIINYELTYSPEIPQQPRQQEHRSSTIIYPWCLLSNILCHSECVMWLQADLSCRQLKLGLSICCGRKKRQTFVVNMTKRSQNGRHTIPNIPDMYFCTCNPDTHVNTVKTARSSMFFSMFSPLRSHWLACPLEGAAVRPFSPRLLVIVSSAAVPFREHVCHFQRHVTPCF